MQIAVGIGPFRFRAINALFGLGHVSLCLFDGGCQAGYVGRRTIDVRPGCGNSTDERCNPALFVSNLSFQRSLFRDRSFKSVLIRTLVDFKQQFTLFHSLVVVHIETRDRSLHLRCNADEVSQNLDIVRSRMLALGVNHHQTENRRCNQNDCACYATGQRAISGVFCHRSWHHWKKVSHRPNVQARARLG